MTNNTKKCGESSWENFFVYDVSEPDTEKNTFRTLKQNASGEGQKQRSQFDVMAGNSQV